MSNQSGDRPLVYLIDASAYIFRAFHAIPQLTTARGLPTNAVYGLTTMLLKFVRDRAPHYVVAVFDAPGRTFRDELYTEYKANRPRPPDELLSQLPFVRRMVSALGLPVREEPGVEADDVIGTLARQANDAGADVVIVTGDKDMMQLVSARVTLLDPMRNKWTTVEDVRKRFRLEPEQLVDVMALMGDAVDNIPGVTGVGEKTATALIKHFGSLERVLADPAAIKETGLRGASRIAETLGREAETARVSRELARIRCELPVTFSLEEFRFQGHDATELPALLQELEFFSLLQDLSPARRPLEIAAAMAATPESLRALAERAAKTKQIAFAARWSVRRPMDAELDELAVATAADAATLVTGLTTAEVLGALGPVLESEEVEKVGEDIKGLMIVAARHGVHVRGPQFDTRIASYVLNPTQEGHDLAALADRHLGVGVEPDRPRGTSAAAVAALRLRPILEAELGAHEAQPLFHELEMPLVRVLAEMEHRGMLVDTARLRALSVEYTAKLEALVAEIYELAGEEFNIHSPPQLRTILFERLRLPSRGVRRGKTGLSTDVDVLRRLAREHPLPGRILEYRALSKLMSTYVDVLPGLVNAVSGRIHSSFHQTVTATGRLSSSDPNLQNIPIRGEEGRRIRAAFRAPAGRILLSADYSQIELRILAHLSGDPVLVDAFDRDEDIHGRTAAEVFGALGGVTEDRRRAAKVINFGIIYGMGPARLARELDIPQDEAARYIKLYFARYAGVQAYVERTVAEARTRGYVATLLNRRRYLPELTAREGALRQVAERTAVNTPIQGSAADLIKLAMLRVERHLRRGGLEACMVLQVHDELVFEVALEAAPQLADVVRREMEGVAELAVPLKVEVHSGESWADAH